MHSVRWRLRIALLVLAVLPPAVLQGVSAQGDERECGDFRSLPNVSSADLVDAASQGCKISAKDATITGDLDARDVTFRDANFWGTIFEGETNFGRAIFEGADVSFLRATFIKDADFSNAIFATRITKFTGTNFKQDANFFGTEFLNSVDFTDGIIEGRTFFGGVKFGGGVWPPHRVGRGTNLEWDQVAHTLPRGQNLADLYGAWENFFASGGQFSEASKVRTARQHDVLRPIIRGVFVSFLILAPLFAGFYYLYFRHVSTSSTPARATPITKGRAFFREVKFGGKVLLFSLDVLLPGLGPLKYDWRVHGKLPVERVAVLTALESVFGWLLLALTSALIVAWLIV